MVNELCLHRYRKFSLLSLLQDFLPEALSVLELIFPQRDYMVFHTYHTHLTK